MALTVASPKLFLRGNQWYVRVQVPTSMQDQLKRKEYWISLKTPSRSEAVDVAVAATQKKRQEIASMFQKLSEGDKAAAEHGFGKGITAASEAQAEISNTTTEHSFPDAAENEDKIKSDNYDNFSKAQLIALLRKHDRTKKLGLVWERDGVKTTTPRDSTFMAAQLDIELSAEPAPWNNLVIEGDNYCALRWLRMTHRGRVKCIYIDPPYNTGNTGWVYNDRYNSEGDRFRLSAWIEFLYRRLKLARDLLTEDGVILMSINDKNRAVADLMMQEALPGMPIGSLVWRTRNGSNADQGGYLSPDHEHILVAGEKGFSFLGTTRNYTTYSNPDNDPRGDWQPVPIRLGFSKDERPNLYYPLHDPATGVYYPCNPDAVWRYATQTRVADRQRLKTQPIEDFIAQGRIIFPTNQRVETFETIEDLEDAIDNLDVPLSGGVPILRRDLHDLSFWVQKPIGFGTPKRKLYKAELKRPTKPLSSWVSGFADTGSASEDVNQITAGSYTEGSYDIRRIFGSKTFNYAKPVSLIRELIRQSTSPTDLVLDFFAGSATTAQAVMELNAEDGGNRRFIMVSSKEATEANPEKNLCRDVTAERVRLLNASNVKRYTDLSAGFAYLRIKERSAVHLDYDLSPSEAWTFLEAYHGLPLTSFNRDRAWNVNQDENTTLVLVDRYDQSLIEWLQSQSSNNIYVYAWAKGPFTPQLDAMNIRVNSVVKTFEEIYDDVQALGCP